MCDFTLVTDRLAEPSDIVYVDGGIKVSTGGHPVNISIDLVKLGMQGDKIKVVTSIGRDLCGDFVLSVLGDFGIDTRWVQVIENKETGKNVIIVIKGQDRRFHDDLGASSDLSPRHVLAAMDYVRPDLIHWAVGLQKEADDSLPTILRAAKDLSAVTFIDIGVATRPKGDWEFLQRALSEGLVDIFHANSYELRKVTGLNDVGKAIDFLLRSGVRVVLLTEGERGALLATNDFTVNQPPFAVPVVDPTGAGDAFQAGFIFYLYRKGAPGLALRSIETTQEEAAKALLYAQAAGASCVTAPGATEAVTKVNVERLLDEQGDDILRRTSILQRVRQ